MTLLKRHLFWSFLKRYTFLKCSTLKRAFILPSCRGARKKILSHIAEQEKIYSVVKSNSHFHPGAVFFYFLE